MTWIAANIQRLMIVAGILTLSMLFAAIAPEAALRSTFGESLTGPLADVVVRNWGALISLIGAMLIYAASRPAVRTMALVVAGTSKLIFITLVLSHGSRLLTTRAAGAIAIDCLWVVVFALYFIAVRRAPTP